MDVDYKEIGLRIRKERTALNLSREKFAEMIELSVNYVGQIERGEKKFSVETIVKISNCLHSSLDYFIKGIDLRVAKNDKSEVLSLLEKCSEYETSLITDLVRVVLPHMK